MRHCETCSCGCTCGFGGHGGRTIRAPHEPGNVQCALYGKHPVDVLAAVKAMLDIPGASDAEILAGMRGFIGIVERQ